MNKFEIKAEMQQKSAKPFLRWAGGKKWLLKELHNFLPSEEYGNYHEPFLGGGAVFFHLKPERISFLNDLNRELIETYNCLKEDVENVIEALGSYENSREFYYKERSKNYKSSIQRAARFIYLNQTSFNGIFRVNLRGEYNVPFGNRTKDFLEPENLRMVGKALQNTILSTHDFLKCLENISEGDLIFLDPPYTISHNNNGFLKYNQKLFTEEDQYRLSAMIDEIKARKAFYILTNAAHYKIKEIFQKNDPMVELKRASLVGGINAKRGKYAELVITNVK